MIYRIRHTDVRIIPSIHVSPPDGYELQRELCTVRNADEVIFESDIDNMEAPESRYLNKTTLKNLIPPDLYKALKNLFDELDVEETFDLLKPWFLGLFLSIHIQLRSGATWGGIDRQLWDEAKREEKPMYTVERTELFSRLDAAPPEESIKLLHEISENPDQPVQIMDRMISAWKSGDLKKIDADFSSLSKSAPSIYYALFAERNLKWFPAFQKAITNRRNTVFVVGCGHVLHGKSSLQALLLNEGYEIKAEQVG